MSSQSSTLQAPAQRKNSAVEAFQERLRFSVKWNRFQNWVGVIPIQLKRNPWPCLKPKKLVVGCEASGTTAIGRTLLANGAKRFLYEGANDWVWDLYMSVYQGQSRVSDYPALQLFDRIKVPGFASILEQFVEAFPNTDILYVVRDPRDVLASAYRTKGVTTREEFAKIQWVEETWLGIEDRDPVARMARRWRIYLECSRKVPQVNYVRYEDFFENKIDCLMRLGELMGVELDQKWILEQRDRQSDFRGYKPVGPGSYNQCPYVSADDIKTVEDICGDLMKEWNYH